MTFKYRTGLFRVGVHRVFSDLTLKIQAGETLGVLGRNGTGKSCLLLLMSGILSPDAGAITMKPNISVSLSTLTLGLDQRLSGFMNAILQGMLLGFDRSEIDAKLPEIISFSELGPAIEDPLFTYSAGMKARLSFAVNRYLQPDVLLIDEMMGVGDETFRNKSMAVLKEKLKSDQTVVLVSHNLSLIQQLCDRAILLDEQRITADGKPSDVIRDYRSMLKR